MNARAHAAEVAPRMDERLPLESLYFGTRVLDSS